MSHGAPGRVSAAVCCLSSDLLLLQSMRRASIAQACRCSKAGSKAQCVTMAELYNAGRVWISSPLCAQCIHRVSVHSLSASLWLPAFDLCAPRCLAARQQTLPHPKQHAASQGSGCCRALFDLALSVCLCALSGSGKGSAAQLCALLAARGSSDTTDTTERRNAAHTRRTAGRTKTRTDSKPAEKRHSRYRRPQAQRKPLL